MSLQHLADMRRARRKPEHVKVLIGTPPKWLGDGPDFIVIRPNDIPALLDLRPLVGIDLTVVELERDDQRFERVIEALQAAGAHITGLVSAAGATGTSPEHEHALNRYRNQLCQ